ncbi:MAG: hypothetical protein IVW51_16800 [Thermaceae bacterium]|nr:hypothetical protein [Thermaceae bacterium]
MRVVAAIYQRQETLEAGFPHPEQARRHLLYQGPAHLSSPSQAWQRATALDGSYSGTLLVHANCSLQAADEVCVNAETWRVLTVAHNAREWRLELGRKDVA